MPSPRIQNVRMPMTSAITSHSSDHQNVAISQSKCDATHVPCASPRFTYAMITPTMPAITTSGAKVTSPDDTTAPIAAIAKSA
ncbi:MAG: hypothetical protein IPF73_07235 [Betaproteobacteria bacterium]|nr:hypothetical protein [Betaproteobacteria bacterium]